MAMSPDDQRKKHIEPHQFKKGNQAAKGKGRPKKLPGLDVMLAEILADEKDGKTAAEAILMAWRSKAVRGDLRAGEMLFERAYGKVKQPLDVELTKPIEIVVRSSKSKSKNED